MTTRTLGLTGLRGHLPDGRGRRCGIIGDWGGGGGRCQYHAQNNRGL